MHAAAPADGPLDLYATGRMPLTLAAMRAVLDAPDQAALDQTIAEARVRWGAVLDPLLARLEPDACARIRRIAGALDHTFQADEPERVLARLAEGFDEAAAVSPDAGVALYSLGDPTLLALATAEVTAWLEAQAILRPGLDVLEVGCGAGRFLQALAGEARTAVGVEISAGMAAEAARRLAGVRNALVLRGSGRDLGFAADAAFGLVLFADSFPYVVQAGGDLPRRMVEEAARVLRPGGRMVVLNWSYRGDPALDVRERDALAAACGLEVTGVAPPRFKHWDASAAVLVKPIRGGG